MEELFKFKFKATIYQEYYLMDQSLIHTLLGNDVALRKDFITSNAINVKNLDV